MQVQAAQPPVNQMQMTTPALATVPQAPAPEAQANMTDEEINTRGFHRLIKLLGNQ